MMLLGFLRRRKKKRVDDYQTLIAPAIAPHKHLLRLHETEPGYYIFLCYNSGCSRRVKIAKARFHEGITYGNAPA